MFDFNCVNVSAPSHLSYTTATVSLVLCLITVAGNLLVCLAVLINPNNNLRNPFNYFVVSLAIADLIVGCVTEPISVYIHVKEGLRMPLAQIEVWSIHLSYFISCTTSVLNISLLAFERFLAITSPVRYRLFFSVPRFITLAVAVWLVSTGLSVIYFFTTYILYAFVFINIAVVLTLGVSGFTYLKIFGELRNRMRAKISSGSLMHRSTTQEVSNRWNVQLTKTYLIILSIFLACYIPALIIIYTMNWCETCSCLTIHCLRDIQFMIVILNSALNPFVYALRFDKFRRAIIEILRCRCKHKPIERRAVSTRSLDTNLNTEVWT